MPNGRSPTFAIMKHPVSYRKGIPFYCLKTERDFQRDAYERYDAMVVRQSALHLADELWGGYPMQAVVDFALDFYPKHTNPDILEVGCGVGRWIATLAQMYPESSCWGIDYSYQMLKQARDHWIQGRDIFLDLSGKGFSNALYVKGHQLTNLQFGLSKATDLPFTDGSQDLIVNSFVFDRLDSPLECLNELYRILKPNGRLITITPLNFDQAILWETLYPPAKIRDSLNQSGFSVLEWKEEIHIKEPLDSRGNLITWKCLCFVASKP